MPGLRSGDVLRIGPGANRLDLLQSFHVIHKDLWKYRFFNAVTTTFSAQEDIQVAGNLRLFPVGVAKASWQIPAVTQCAVDTLLSFISFNGLDSIVTMRTWTGRVFKDYWGYFSYQPPDDTNPFYVFDAVFNFNGLRVIP